MTFLRTIAMTLMALAATMFLTMPAAAETDGNPERDETNDEIGTGRLLAVTKDNKKIDIPLTHTSVDAQVGGFLSRVTVTQTFVNNSKDPIEAVYVFPLPHDAAVDDMTMTIGERVIKGVIKKREEAQKIYEDAKREGKTASLLDQERPNIFTQHVANILPGDKIEIRISYANALAYVDDYYEFVFPMVVGPRYIPGEKIVGKSGGGWAPDTNRVPDASRIAPPVLKPDERSGHDIDVTLHIDAGVPIEQIDSPSHAIDISAQHDAKATITLDPRDTIPNKDLIVRYSVLGRVEDAGVVTYTEDRQGHFILMLAPKADYSKKEIVPREILFIVDSSGSQAGDAMTKSKEAVKRALMGLREGDTFQVYNFNDIVTSMSPEPVPATTENVKEARRFVDRIQATGGTRMLPVIQSALVLPPDKSRLRIVFMTTDGLIGNEDEIIKELHDNLGDARLFTLGVGGSVNRYLLDRMAEEGRGYSRFVRPDEPTKEVVETFYARLDTPVMADIEVDWGGLSVADVYPARVPDLYAGQPVVLQGRFTKPGSGRVRLLGRLGDGSGEIKADVAFPAEDGGYAALPTMWARAKVERLDHELQYGRGDRGELTQQITALGLEYRLMTDYTSFVAVEEKVRNEGGKQTTVQVPVELPEGMQYDSVFGAKAEMATADVAIQGRVMRSKAFTGAGAGAAAPPPPAMSVAQASGYAADEAEDRAPRGDWYASVDPVAFLGIADEGPYRRDLSGKVAPALTEKLKAYKDELKGKELMVRVALSPEGKVTKVELVRGTMSAKAKAALEKAMKDQSLPKPGKDATLVFFVRF